MFIEAFKYKRWADERTLRAIEIIDRGTHPDSYSFALQQINHMVIVEELFSGRLKNIPARHKSTSTIQVPTLIELDSRLMASCDWFSGYVSRLEDAERSIKFTFADGMPGMMTIQEILFHVVSHGSYHRGTIAHALDLALVPHPIDGYGIYIHEKKPERRKQ